MSTLAGRVAVVTGAGQGIGRGIALAFASEGASVVVADLNETTAQAVVKEIGERGAQGLAVRCDVTDRGDIDRCIKATLDRFGGLNILVNNAIATNLGFNLDETTDENYDLVMETGPKATFLFMRAAFPHLRGNGRVINLRSGSEVSALPGMCAYVAAKAAVGALTRVAAREWGKHGVTVNALMPFALAPTMKAYYDANPQLLEEAFAGMAIPRFGDPEADIGRAAVFLAGPNASFITGTTISVDGGGALV
jgi:NAD(P)-dependent dehydrogenase (short-subunit alcohol dehydrogenase family)